MKNITKFATEFANHILFFSVFTYFAALISSDGVMASGFYYNSLFEILLSLLCESLFAFVIVKAIIEK